MDFFGDAFEWHPRFLPPVARPDGLLLIGEGELLRLDMPGVVALARPLGERISLAALCASDGPPVLLAQMLHALDALARQGLVRPVAPRGGERFVVPDFSLPPRRIAVREGVEAIVLTEALDEATALRWTRAVAAQAEGLAVVFCDDLLDPRLAAIDRQRHATRQPWLPVKPTGERAMVGPLFASPAGARPACWHCLAHRLRRNQPARAWWESRQGARSGGLPARADAALVEARLEDLRPRACYLLAQQAQRLWTLAPDAPHAVHARPQCPHCGDAGRMARRQQRPIVLSSARGEARVDGGWRSMPAEATLERLAPHLDALGGVVARLLPLGEDMEDGLTVYRSEIFKPPPASDDPAPGALVQPCLGKGMSSAQSRASALCEAIERHAAFFEGDEACVVAPASALDAPCIPPEALALFSARQRAHFDDPARRPPHAVARPAPRPGETAWWAPAWSLTAGARRYLPFGFCYAHAPRESRRHSLWTSNGCAAGNTREEAILQGMLELVERDAAAIWWYGAVRRRAIDAACLPPATRARVARSLGAAWRHWLLDLTHDFGIPVAAAVGRHRATGRWAIGFGCSPDAVLACERALTEMAQLIAAQKTFDLPPDVDPSFLMPAEEGGATAAASGRAAGPVDIAREIERCVAIAASLGMETVVLDHTRPDIPLHTVKVVVPGLCHIWPELGNPRLYRVPVALGWRGAALREEELNPQPLYV